MVDVGRVSGAVDEEAEDALDIPPPCFILETAGVADLRRSFLLFVVYTFCTLVVARRTGPVGFALTGSVTG